MKKLKLKTFVKVFAFVTAFSAFFFVACSKDDNANSDPSEQNAFKEPTPKEQAESLIKTNYRYLKYYFGQKKPEDYVNKSIRKEVKENHAKIQKEYEGLSAEATINKMESEGVMSKEMAKVMLDLKSTADALQNVKTIKELENKLSSFESQIYDNKNLNEEEKIIAATTSGTLREVMRYFDEIQQGPDDDEKSLKDGSLKVRSGCLWGRKVTCYAGVIIKTGAGAWKGVKSTPLLGIKGSIVGAAFGFLEGILDLFKDTCKCDEPSQFQCFTPIGINIIFPSNNPCAATARFSTWGTGTQPSASNGQTLNWTVKVFNSDGTFKNTIIQGLPHSGTTLMDAINIPEPGLNMEIIVVRVCGGQEFSTSFWVNLRDLLDDPGSVIVSGSSDALFLETITYNLNGECLINPNNQHQWTIPSQATLVSGGGTTTSARVTWNTRTCSGSGGSSGWGGCFRPTLTAKSTSGCSGTQSWGWLSVAVR